MKRGKGGSVMPVSVAHSSITLSKRSKDGACTAYDVTRESVSGAEFGLAAWSATRDLANQVTKNHVWNCMQ